MKNKTAISTLLMCLFISMICLFINSLNLGHGLLKSNQVSGQVCYPTCLPSVTPQQPPVLEEADPAVQPFSTYTCSSSQAGWLEIPGYEIRITLKWNVTWPPRTGSPVVNSVIVPDKGKWSFGNGGGTIDCPPIFLTPVSSHRNWSQDHYQRRAQWNGDIGTCSCFQWLGNITTQAPAPTQSECPCSPCPSQPPSQGCTWDSANCSWTGCPGSPIIIDLDNDGFALTDAAHGVRFDLTGTGQLDQWSWTARGSNDAFLALDRDNDGSVDSGKELFGDFTDQPVTERPNGFIALATFDDNNDSWIDRNDAIYRKLLLWVDSNHDGISQRRELHSLEWGGVERIGLDYKESKRTDRYGNNFRYRAPVRGRDLGRWAWDVFLLTQ